MRFYLIGFGSASLIFVALGFWFYLSVPNDQGKENGENANVVYRDREVVKKVLVREPLPSKFVNYKSIDTARLWNGVDSNSLMNVTQGQSASKERIDKGSYTFDFTVNFCLTSTKAFGCPHVCLFVSLRFVSFRLGFAMPLV